MHNIKEIINNLDLFKDSLKKRFLEVDVNNILELDKKNRKLIQDKENLEKEKKEISKSKDKELFEKSKNISNQINILSKNQLEVKNKLDAILSSIKFEIALSSKANLSLTKTNLDPVVLVARSKSSILRVLPIS